LPVALFVGAFDPLHDGHLAAVELAARTVPGLCIIVAVEPRERGGGAPWAQRQQLAHLALADAKRRGLLASVFVAEDAWHEATLRPLLLDGNLRGCLEAVAGKAGCPGVDLAYQLLGDDRWRDMPAPHACGQVALVAQRGGPVSAGEPDLVRRLQQRAGVLALPLGASGGATLSSSDVRGHVRAARAIVARTPGGWPAVRADHSSIRGLCADATAYVIEHGLYL